jgi:hypothetical protein
LLRLPIISQTHFEHYEQFDFNPQQLFLFHRSCIPRRYPIHHLDSNLLYIGCGFLSAFLNLYLIFLFVKYPKLKDTPCNWIIIQQCLSEVLMGYGTVMRAVTFLFATNFTIINFDLSFCFWVGGLCSVGYRIGQTIALLMAIDRLLAIWKPGFYATRHVNVTFKKSWFENVF